MRVILVIALSVMLLSIPTLSFADTDVVKTVVTAVEENPGKSVGVAGCAAVIILPPAAIWCAATIIAGATIDGDTQELLKIK